MQNILISKNINDFKTRLKIWAVDVNYIFQQSILDLIDAEIAERGIE